MIIATVLLFKKDEPEETEDVSVEEIEGALNELVFSSSESSSSRQVNSKSMAKLNEISGFHSI